MGLPLARSWHVCGVALALPFPLGPPCMETFLNKPHASPPTACPVSSCIRGGSGAMLGGTEPDWAGYPPAHRCAQSPTRRVSLGEIRGRNEAVHGGTGTDPCSRVPQGNHCRKKGLFSWHWVQ